MPYQSLCYMLHVIISFEVNFKKQIQSYGLAARDCVGAANLSYVIHQLSYFLKNVFFYFINLILYHMGRSKVDVGCSIITIACWRNSVDLPTAPDQINCLHAIRVRSYCREILCLSSWFRQVSYKKHMRLLNSTRSTMIILFAGAQQGQK